MLDLLGLGGSLIAGGVVLAVIAGIVWRIRRSGFNAARAAQAKADARAVAKRDEIEEAVSGRSAEENRRKLWTKP